MQNIQPLDLLLDQRKEHWLMHCRFVLEQLLMPICREGLVKTTTPLERAIVLIENRVDKQCVHSTEHMADVSKGQRVCTNH